MIDENSIREVSQRSNCVTVVGRLLSSKAGTLFKGLCPFHESERRRLQFLPFGIHITVLGAERTVIRFAFMEVGGRQFPSGTRIG